MTTKWDIVMTTNKVIFMTFWKIGTFWGECKFCLAYLILGLCHTQGV